MASRASAHAPRSDHERIQASSAGPSAIRAESSPTSVVLPSEHVTARSVFQEVKQGTREAGHTPLAVSS
jgi:hypothetical protein